MHGQLAGHLCFVSHMTCLEALCDLPGGERARLRPRFEPGLRAETARDGRRLARLNAAFGPGLRAHVPKQSALVRGVSQTESVSSAGHSNA